MITLDELGGVYEGGRRVLTDVAEGISEPLLDFPTIRWLKQSTDGKNGQKKEGNKIRKPKTKTKVKQNAKSVEKAVSKKRHQTLRAKSKK